MQVKLSAATFPLLPTYQRAADAPNDALIGLYPQARINILDASPPGLKTSHIQHSIVQPVGKFEA